MSPTWPVLGNRPIDQWKVVELKEELKRRRLPVKGLKDDLIRRLDEALRHERESVQEVEVDDAKPEIEVADADSEPVAETAKNMDQGDRVAKTMANSVEKAGMVVNVVASPQGKEQEGEVTDGPESVQEVVDTDIPSDRKPDLEVADADSVPAVETAENMDQGDSIAKTMANSVEQAGTDFNVVASTQGKEQEGEVTVGPESGQELMDTGIPSDRKPDLEVADADSVPVVEIAENMDQGDNIEKTKANSVEQAGTDVNVVAAPRGKQQEGEVTNGPESVQELVDTGIPSDRKPDLEFADADSMLVVERAENMEQGDNIEKTKANSVEQAGTDVNVVASPWGKEKEGEVTNGPDSARDVQEVVVRELSAETITLVETRTMVSESVVSERGVSAKGSQDIEIQEDSGASGSQLENEESAVQLENEESAALLETEDLKLHPIPEDAQPPQKESRLKLSVSNNQVSEVSTTLGTQVKSESISTESVSINEKNELKDNIIADNVILELDTVKPDMVQTPSSNVVQDDAESHSKDVSEPSHSMDVINEPSHPMDVDESHENKVPIEEIKENNANADTSEKNDSAELVYSEKLNLDRSSGEDSMEEDLLEGKQIDSEFNPDDAGGNNEEPALAILKEEGIVDVVVDDSSAREKDVYVNSNHGLAAPSVKRKLHEQETRENNEPQKRQRRWNPDSLNVPLLKKPNVAAFTTPTDSVQPTMLRHKFSRSDSVHCEDSTKERVVPPSQKSPTNSLRIDQFLRPFTLKAVQELLGKTGTVVSFWMDHIKTHCYVTYSSAEEAMETRNAVYNLQWPANGGRLLVADFVDPNEVKMRVEAPPQAPAAPPVSAVPAVAPAVPPPQPQPSPRNHVSRQQLLPPPPFLPPPPPVARELPLPPPPPLARPEKQEPPIVTLDDLFKKTKATPRIYYLPLSKEQVAAKRAAVGRNIKQ